jgi:hypothetical protein
MHYPTSWSGTQKSTAGMEQLAHGIVPQAALMVVSTVPFATAFAQTPSFRNRIAVTVYKTHIPVHGYPGPDDISFPLAETFADLPATCRAPVYQCMVMQ